ncbi:MAG: hypothetical protein J6U45_06455 [Alistipes sp.]|nr:hypothetical protein [Alistipes sp.]
MWRAAARAGCDRAAIAKGRPRGRPCSGCGGVCGAPRGGGRGVAGVAGVVPQWRAAARAGCSAGNSKGATAWPPLLVGVGVCGAPPARGRGVAGVAPRLLGLAAGCDRAAIAKGRPRGRPCSGCGYVLPLNRNNLRRA